jgi:hypothetical protein
VKTFAPQRKMNNVRFQVLTAASHSSLMMEAVRTSETSVDNHFTRQYNPEDSSEQKMNKAVTMLKLPDVCI